ncbi:hypothetical protein BH10ACT5_BH10ACT5_16280 [soil metagenome]|jgi:LysM repeat protein|uniref:LysM peptidoglycan-binding domain-containing protein n=2 Tax=Microbacterium sp. TaxID=51671 RepID=UPI0025F9EFBB|nr:LysM peptidoglycan-binding domain-containing protein [Microbacterium sp.]
MPKPSSVRVPTAATPETYEVQAGDSVSTIAARHGLRTTDVLAINGLSWSSTIYPGQVLRLAAVTAPEAAPPAPAAPAPPAARAYVVAGGDTISAIARLHGVSTQELLDANGLNASSIIYPGQSIAVPPTPSLTLVANTTTDASTTMLDAEQIANARIIIGVGRELGVPDRGIAIALGTAMQESWLRNLDWGDRDSLGLFQQRPSTGWGTPEQVRDAVHAARTFYGGPSDPNGYLTRGLLDVQGWQELSFANAAQSVQISAYPDRYAQWEQPASAWLAALG